MSIPKPFKRIIRPMVGSSKYDDNIYISESYNLEKNSTARAFQLIIQDLNDIIYYIEPVLKNFSVYSHKIYSLFLRTSTEFESNCKGILKENCYPKKSNLSIKDYCKINPSMKLSDYSIKFPKFDSGLETKPFQEWNNSEKKLSWYQDYNLVKHNREKEFKKANLGNLMSSIAGLVIIIFAQYSTGGIKNIYDPFIISYDGYYALLDEMIYIKPPKWKENEKYDFDWKKLRNSAEPFQNYLF